MSRRPLALSTLSAVSSVMSSSRYRMRDQPSWRARRCEHQMMLALS
ncbi:MAG TPA: hypothetical protein VFW16_00600 [Streptosporangiaceae bacterium]|nr:hypothetical protein [Streptosporangiaceae bacterium]